MIGFGKENRQKPTNVTNLDKNRKMYENRFPVHKLFNLVLQKDYICAVK
jgi:uncharacterized protein YhbP (UPF0306 family)